MANSFSLWYPFKLLLSPNHFTPVYSKKALPLTLLAYVCYQLSVVSLKNKFVNFSSSNTLTNVNATSSSTSKILGPDQSYLRFLPFHRILPTPQSKWLYTSEHWEGQLLRQAAVNQLAFGKTEGTQTRYLKAALQLPTEAESCGFSLTVTRCNYKLTSQKPLIEPETGSRHVQHSDCVKTRNCDGPRESQPAAPKPSKKGISSRALQPWKIKLTIHHLAFITNNKPNWRAGLLLSHRLLPLGRFKQLTCTRIQIGTSRCPKWHGCLSIIYQIPGVNDFLPLPMTLQQLEH